MSKHTPGPWRYERDDRKPHYNPKYCAHSHVWGPVVTIHCPGGNLDRNEPDMLLIAAAPDMIAALHTARPALIDAGATEALAAVDAAIAKAEGMGSWCPTPS